jgi:hypothetical protein
MISFDPPRVLSFEPPPGTWGAPLRPPNAGPIVDTSLADSLLEAWGRQSAAAAPDASAILTLLQNIQSFASRRPEVVQMIASALAAEGRAFAMTDPGRAWREALDGSALLKNVRLVWEALNLQLPHGPAQVSPAIEGLFQAANRPDLESLVVRLLSP